MKNENTLPKNESQKVIEKDTLEYGDQREIERIEKEFLL